MKRGEAWKALELSLPRVLIQTIKHAISMILLKHSCCNVL